MHGLHFRRRQFGHRHGIVIGAAGATAMGRWTDSSIRRGPSISTRIATFFAHETYLRTLRGKPIYCVFSSSIALGFDFIATAYFSNGAGATNQPPMDAPSRSYADLPCHLDSEFARNHAHTLVDRSPLTKFQWRGHYRWWIFPHVASSLPSQGYGAQHLAHRDAFLQPRHGSKARESLVSSWNGGCRQDFILMLFHNAHGILLENPNDNRSITIGSYEWNESTSYWSFVILNFDLPALPCEDISSSKKLILDTFFRITLVHITFFRLSHYHRWRRQSL